MKLSIVATLYRSEEYIAEFVRRVSAVAARLVGNAYEIVLVNDGSPDKSLQVAKEIAGRDPHLMIVDLSRNFGHHKAIMTGLAHTRGESVFLIDIDLEEPPEILEKFSAHAASTGADVVYGVQERRKGGFVERVSGAVFYRVFRFLAGMALPENVVTARVMSRRYVDALLRHQEREIFLAGLWHITGFLQTPMIVTKQSSSPTTYTFSKKVALLINSVTSFSNTPLIFIFYFGLLISACSGVYTLYLVINSVFFSQRLAGWTSTIASIWLIGGMIISFIGVIGIYLAKIFSETKQRPYTIVREVYGQSLSRDPR